MDLVHELPCPRCGTENYFHNAVTRINWFCLNCDAYCFASFGTMDGTKIMKNPNRTGALIANELDQLEEVPNFSEWYPMGAYDNSLDPKRPGDLRFIVESLLPSAPIIGEPLVEESNG